MPSRPNSTPILSGFTPQTPLSYPTHPPLYTPLPSLTLPPHSPIEHPMYPNTYTYTVPPHHHVIPPNLLPLTHMILHSLPNHQTHNLPSISPQSRVISARSRLKIAPRSVEIERDTTPIPPPFVPTHTTKLLSKFPVHIQKESC